MPAWTWIGILVTTAVFQLFRGAPADVVPFALMAVLLAADAFGLLGGRFPARTPAPPRVLLAVVAVVSGAVLVIAPAGSPVGGSVLVLLGAAVFVLGWPGTREPSDAASPRSLTHSAVVWGLLAVALCLWELASFFLGLPSARASAAHPTISSLVDPFVGWPPGRVLFVTLWLIAGAVLLRRRP